MLIRLSNILLILAILLNYQSALADAEQSQTNSAPPVSTAPPVTNNSVQATSIQAPPANVPVSASAPTTNNSTQAAPASTGNAVPNPYGGVMVYPKVGNVVTFHADTAGCKTENDLVNLITHIVNKEMNLVMSMMNNTICGFISSSDKFKVLSTDKLGGKIDVIQFVNVKDAAATWGYWSLSASVKEIVP